MADYDFIEMAERFKQRGSDRRGAIYYVSFGEDGPIKIGFCDSFAAVDERLRGFQTGCPYRIEILGVKAGSIADERALHHRFRTKWMRGEWFDRHKALMTHIESVTRRKDCREWLPRFEKYHPLPGHIREERYNGKIHLVQWRSPILLEIDRIEGVR